MPAGYLHTTPSPHYDLGIVLEVIIAVAHVTRAIGTAVAFSALVLPTYAVLPDEIQVYTGDISTPGEFGLELHVNTAPNDIGMSSYPGEVMTPHGWHATMEFSYGLAPSLEPGLYVPTTLTCESTFYVTGPKVRMRWMPVRPVDGTGNLAGVNVKLAHAVGHSKALQNTAELRSIYGYQNDRWPWAVNLVLDRNLPRDKRSGVPKAAPGFKAARTVATGTCAGTKYYAGPGPIDHIASLHERQRTVFLVFDMDRKPFVSNSNIGRGLTYASDHWTLKWIFEILLS